MKNKKEEEKNIFVPIVDLSTISLINAFLETKKNKASSRSS